MKPRKPWTVVERIDTASWERAFLATQAKARGLAYEEGIDILAVFSTKRKGKAVAAIRRELVVWLRERFMLIGSSNGSSRRVIVERDPKWEPWKTSPLSWQAIAALLGFKHHTSALCAYRAAKGETVQNG